MSLYKYVAMETLKKILECRAIRFTQPGALNDPFEMVPEIFAPEEMDKKELSISFDVLAPRRPETVIGVDDDADPKGFSDETSRNIRKLLDREIGILCLTRNPSSLTMWAHYANSYSGALLEFDSEHEFFQGAIDVEYKKERPKRNVTAYMDGRVPISELCVKSCEWEYESEVRIVRRLSDCRKDRHDDGFPIYVMDLPKDCITSIALGERTAVDDQRFVFTSIMNTTIALKLAAAANWNYEFRLEPVKWDRPISELSPIISPRTAHIFTNLDGEFGDLARWMISEHPYSRLMNDTL